MNVSFHATTCSLLAHKVSSVMSLDPCQKMVHTNTAVKIFKSFNVAYGEKKLLVNGRCQT